jgi:hypothetical protein
MGEIFSRRMVIFKKLQCLHICEGFEEIKHKRRLSKDVLMT